MVLPKKGHLLRIFIGETDKKNGVPLYEWIVKKAREHGLAGATVTRGVLGFGAHSLIHTTKILRLSEDMPMVIEIVDTLDKIDAFIPIINNSITEGLAIVEEVRIPSQALVVLDAAARVDIRPVFGIADGREVQADIHEFETDVIHCYKGAQGIFIDYGGIAHPSSVVDVGRMGDVHVVVQDKVSRITDTVRRPPAGR